MTYREAVTALKAEYPEGCTYAAFQATTQRLAGGYAQGVRLRHELARMEAFSMLSDGHGYWVTITKVSAK